MRAQLFALGMLIGACGDDGGTLDDASMLPATITISGTAKAYTASGTVPIEGVTIGAYRANDESTAVVTVTSGADGSYSLTFETNGIALDGYLKGTLPNYMDTYLYPPTPVSMEFSGATVAMLTSDIFDLLANTFCHANQTATGRAAIAAIVLDAGLNPLAGATVGSSPAATKYCYNKDGFPNRMATATEGDGTAYFLDLPPGRVTVNAMASGATYPTHSVLARPDVLTTTLFQVAP